MSLEDVLAQTLYKAYQERKSVKPFEVTMAQAKRVFNVFSSMLVQSEGFGGYKISLTTEETLKRFGSTEPLYGILTKPMIETDSEVELWFETHMAEVEIVFEMDHCTVESYPTCVNGVYLGIELPATRFDTWNLKAYHILADDSAAGRLFVGEAIKLPFNEEVELYLNGNKVGKGRPRYVYGTVDDMVKWLLRRVGYINGYVSSGVFVGPINVKKGDRLRVKGGSLEYEVRLS
jgi:2-keto-4-pentenoate hydratase